MWGITRVFALKIRKFGLEIMDHNFFEKRKEFGNSGFPPEVFVTDPRLEILYCFLTRGVSATCFGWYAVIKKKLIHHFLQVVAGHPPFVQINTMKSRGIY